jgi:crotonobetainyl-CoA:carnitine CoA-transferase CaiB-like acyl-CoA transferase
MEGILPSSMGHKETAGMVSIESALIQPGMTPPLAGIRFIHLGQSRAGRRLATLLAQQGATSQPAPWNTDAADVVIDDRTGMDRDDDDGGRARAVSAGVIWLTLADFPRGHSAWQPASHLLDALIHAELGLNRTAPGGAVRPEPLAIASAFGAMWGALYVAGALSQREAGGPGDAIELSLFAATVTVIGRKLVRFDDASLIDFLDTPHLPLAEIFECADGRYVQNHGMYPHFARIACEVFGRPEWGDGAAAGIPALPEAASEAMWRARFAAVFKERPALAWEEAINAAGGSCTMCRTREEWLAEPHAREAGILMGETGEEKIGPAVVVTMAARPQATAKADAASIATAADTGVPCGAVKAASARSGVVQRTDEPTLWRTTGPEDAGLPLAGLRVVDLCIVLAGPACGRTLAELGADVVKVDDARRLASPTGWIDVNRGKRSVLLDLKQPEGRSIARRLILSADVVLSNFRRGKLERLGLGYDEIRKLRPDIIYAQLNAFDHGGRLSSRAGWEHNAQALTGMQTAREQDGVPHQVPVATNDYTTGLLGAYGVLLALRQRQRHGVGVQITGSLTRSATFIQQEELMAGMRGAGTAPDVVGLARTRAARCADDWVRWLDREGQLPAGLTPEDLTTMPAEAAAAGLRAHGIAVSVERTIPGMAKASMANQALHQGGLIVSWDHPQWGPMQQGSAMASTVHVRKRPGWPAPDRGTDTATILAGLGYAPAEIEHLLAQGVAHGRIASF